MDNNKLKVFAQQTRRKLIELIGAKLSMILSTDSAQLRGREKDVDELRRKVSSAGEDTVIEEVAYTWFNRIMALRFMDANDYNDTLVVTPAAGSNRPEILENALGGSVSSDLNVSISEINDILQGKTGSADPHAAVFRKLLIAKCNALGEIMPFLFEHISDYTELLLPDDLLSNMSFVTDIRNGMSDEDCQHEQIIGWLYQYYVSEKNEQLIQSKKRYKRDELAPASQLFTPEWIVRYMVDNTLGQLWSEMHPDTQILSDLEFYIHPEDPSAIPPRKVKPVEEIMFFDPCVGSAHILSYAFDVFFKMYEEQGYTRSEIPLLILKHNLYGTDIDPRAAQLSAFVLTMKARRQDRRFFRHPVKPNIAYYKDFPEDEKFAQAASLGSLINVSPDEAKKHLTSEHAVDIFHSKEDSDLLDTLYAYLGQRYDCVVTNPPYINSGRMDETTKSFVDSNYSNTRSDLFATFIIRCLDLSNSNGFTGYMTPFVWMFINSYEELRKYIINKSEISSLIQLEYSGFKGATVPICTFVLRNRRIYTYGSYIRLSDFKGAEAQSPKTLEAIQNRNCGWFFLKKQEVFKNIPQWNIGYWASENIIKSFDNPPLSDFARPRAGMITGDNSTFLRLWTEVSIKKFGPNCKSIAESVNSHRKWFPYQKGGAFRRWYGNNEYVVNYENDGWLLKNTKDSKGKVPAHAFNENYIFRPNINWSALTAGIFSVRISTGGFLFDAAGSAAFPTNVNDIYPLGAFLNSKIIKFILGIINPTINFQAWQIGSLPIKPEIFSDAILNLSKQNRDISKDDWDAHEVSWDFMQNELVEISRNIDGKLEDSYKAFELLWSKKIDLLKNNEEELNRQFIKIYGLEDELTPDVPLEEITILQQGEKRIEDGQLKFNADEVIRQLLSYLVGCCMGRYSIDKPGLILADQGDTLENYLKQVSIPTIPVDDDGIIPVLDGEFFADDVTARIKDAVKRVFGEEHYLENIHFIEDSLGKDIRSYMTKDFYAWHLQKYQKRPIYWMFRSKKGAFQALVYMHRMQPDTLSKMLADYVRPYISTLEQNRNQLIENSERGDISTRDKNCYTKEADAIGKKLLELRDYEKELMDYASRRISIDLDDGVKHNYALFGKLVAKI